MIKLNLIITEKTTDFVKIAGQEMYHVDRGYTGSSRTLYVRPHEYLLFYFQFEFHVLVIKERSTNDECMLIEVKTIWVIYKLCDCGRILWLYEVFF